MRFGVAVLGSMLVLGCAGETGAGDPFDGGLLASHDASLDAPADARARDARIAPADAPPDAPIDAHVPRPPPYPIVLAHGFFGFEDFAGAGFIDYFWRVREDLAAHGETEVFTPAVDPFNDSTVRGAQLLAEVERVLAETGADRVNIIGHSQGGLDARVVAHEHPELVASVTTIATPHGGTRVSDVILGIVSDPDLRDLLDAIARAVAAPLYDADGNETSVFSALEQFGSEGIAQFNRDYPDARGVAYFSIGGRTDWHRGGGWCSLSSSPEFIARWSPEIDPVDALLSVSETILNQGIMNLPNDGLVTIEASEHGRFLGCIPADHFDEIGQLLGDGGGLGNDFDHLAFYRELVAWLRSQGF